MTAIYLPAKIDVKIVNFLGEKLRNHWYNNKKQLCKNEATEINFIKKENPETI